MLEDQSPYFYRQLSRWQRARAWVFACRVLAMEFMAAMRYRLTAG